MGAGTVSLTQARDAVPLHLQDVHKRYGTTAALCGVDLAIAAGEVFALLGPNGAGKTTTVRVVTGLVRPTTGFVRLFGLDPASRRARERLGVMLQESRLPDGLRVGELIALFRSYYDAAGPSRRELVELAGLQGLESRPVEKLSGGQVQRLKLALALSGSPGLAVLDEPTVGLDIASRRACWDIVEILAASGCAVLLTTHHLEEAERLAHRIALLERGRILATGTPDEIRACVAVSRIGCRSRATPGLLRALPGYVRASEREGRIELLTSQPEEALRALLAKDPDLRDLEVRRASLEEAVLQLLEAAALEEVA